MEGQMSQGGHTVSIADILRETIEVNAVYYYIWSETQGSNLERERGPVKQNKALPFPQVSWERKLSARPPRPPVAKSI